uniref:FAS1 domain-containing protein n=1 Tax=Tetradesmus obliquus TaxID=3088 RepID=A0A383V7E0_TETOB|eukprot:jgi/Sobl393_1/3051/SZX61071.1
MKSTVILVLCVGAVVALAAPTQAQSPDVFSWMDKHAKGFKSLVNLLGITRARLPAKTKGTLLVPSDKVGKLGSSSSSSSSSSRLPAKAKGTLLVPSDKVRQQQD